MNPSPSGIHIYAGLGNCGTSHLCWHDPPETDSHRGSIAWVDADIRHPRFGPPGTAVLAIQPSPTSDPLQPTVRLRTFCGALLPEDAPGVTLQCIFQLVQTAQAASAGVIRVDLPPVAWPQDRPSWLLPVLLALQPEHVTWVADAPWHGPFERWVRSVSGANVRCLLPDPSVRRRSEAVRALHQTAALSRHFEKASWVNIDPIGVPQIGTEIGNGDQLPPQRCRWAAEILELPIVFGQRDSRGGLTLWTSVARPPSRFEEHAGLLEEALGGSPVRIASLSSRFGTVLGMHDLSGQFRGLGRLEGWDSDLKAFRVRVPSSLATHQWGHVHWGCFKIAPDCRMLPSRSGLRQKRGTAPGEGLYFE